MISDNKITILETLTFYPHYCYACGSCYISSKRLDWCWHCHSWNVINCFDERGKKNNARKQIPKESD